MKIGVVLAAILGCASAQVDTMWPTPRSVSCSDDAHAVNSRRFQFDYSGSSAVIHAATARYTKIMFGTDGRLEVEDEDLSRRPPFTVSIDVDDDSATVPSLDMDESYTIEINRSSATISAPATYGAIRGLESLSQLVWWEPNEGGRSRKAGSYRIPSSCSLQDSPKFAHRGVLIDSSRNFLTVDDIKRTIDGLMFNKMNVLHWHLVDSQSFPFYSSSNPELSEEGSYGPRVYSPQDVEDIIEYANIAGVRVIPEFDSPGHCWEGWKGWAPGVDSEDYDPATDDMTVCGGHTPWTEACAEPPCGQLNPLNDNVYKVLDGLWEDVTSAFPDGVVHMGGDEVNFACWNTSQAIQDHLESRGLPVTDPASFVALWNDFMSRAVPMATQRQREVTVWEESFTHGLKLPTETIVQVWVSKATLSDATAAGHRVVLSDADHMYLDCGAGNWITGGNSWCDPFKSWQMVYGNDPLDMSEAKAADGSAVAPLTPEQEALVIGAEAALFGEMVDSTVLDSKLWPRAAAAGERLWSYANTSQVSELVWQEAQPRLMIQRERMVARGVGAAPLMPRWCLDNPKDCPWPA